MKNTNIVLIDIIEDGIKILEPLGLASITSVLRNEGFNTIIYALHEKDIPYTQIIDLKPDLIGLTIQKYTINNVFKFCRKVKKTLPLVKIFIGGYLSTYNYEEILLHCDLIDIAVKGEGEYVTRDIANAIECGDDFMKIPSIAYRKNNQIIDNGIMEPINDLDDLPYPSRDILSLNNIRLAQIEGSRGCTSTCAFCSLHNFWTNNHKAMCSSWRTKSVKRFVDEIEEMNKIYKIDRFSFLDCSYENPYNDHIRMMQIANEIIRRGLKIFYYINTRTTFYKIANNELMCLLIKSGLSGIFIGAETFYEPDLKLFGKTATMSDNINAVNSLRQYPINVDIGLINFHPYTSLEGLKENMLYLKKFEYSKTILYFSNLSPFKGTQLYQKIIDDKLMEDILFKDGEVVYPKYNFINNKVQDLYDFLNEFINGISDIIEKINYYGNDHLDLLIYLSRLFNNTKGKQVIEKYNIKFKEIAKDYQNKTFDCFSGLLVIAENGWNKTEAQKIVDSTLSYDYLTKYVKKLDNNKIKLFFTLSRIDAKIIKEL